MAWWITRKMENHKIYMRFCNIYNRKLKDTVFFYEITKKPSNKNTYNIGEIYK